MKKLVHFKKNIKLLKIDIPYIGLNMGDAIAGAGAILGDVDVETLRKELEQFEK